jgi:hypothetical protein
MVEERQKIEKPVTKTKRVRDGKVAKVIALLKRGYKDLDKIAAETGASRSTCAVQYYKYRKENGEPINAAQKARMQKLAEKKAAV